MGLGPWSGPHVDSPEVAGELYRTRRHRIACDRSLDGSLLDVIDHHNGHRTPSVLEFQPELLRQRVEKRQRVDWFGRAQRV